MDEGEILAPKIILKYFQLLGLHLINDEGEIYWKIYQIFLFFCIILSCLCAFIYKTFLSEYESTVGAVSLLESKFNCIFNYELDQNIKCENFSNKLKRKTDKIEEN